MATAKSIPKFPKPGQVKQKKLAVRVMKDGREICDLTTQAGKEEYNRRKMAMWVRQGNRCCFAVRLIPSDECIGVTYLPKLFVTFEHDEGRGSGGGHRDDRIAIEVTDKKTGKKKWININGASCPYCNARKGSVRLSKMIADETIP